MSEFLKHLKIGFIGCGNLAQSLMSGLIESGVPVKNLYATNRSFGKLENFAKATGIHKVDSVETLLEECKVIVVAVKPQDFLIAIENLHAQVDESHTFISLAAGISLEALKKVLPTPVWIRAVPNTASEVKKSVTGLYAEADILAEKGWVADLFRPLGSVYVVEDEASLDTLLVATSSGIGFVIEIMNYWQEWLEEHGYPADEARSLVVDTFLGAATLTASKENSLSDIQSAVVSKKGVTAAGLESMQELEIERALRISFEKAALRGKEIGLNFLRQTKV